MRHGNWYTIPYVRRIATTSVICLIAFVSLSVNAGAAARSVNASSFVRHCPNFVIPHVEGRQGLAYRVFGVRSVVTCSTADRLIRESYTGGGRVTYPLTGPREPIFVLAGGWRCTTGAGGIGCWSTAHARDNTISTRGTEHVAVLAEIGSSPVGSAVSACSLAGGEEGGFALPFSATGIGCSAAIPVVKDVIYSGGPCNITNLTGAGCEAALGFVCRIPTPTTPGYISAGDMADCIKGTERIEVEVPG